MGRQEHSRNSDSSAGTAASVHDSLVQLRRTTQAPLAAAVRQRATRSKRFSTEHFARNRLPKLGPARSVSVPPATPPVQHFPPAPTDADRAELESRMSRLTYVSGLTGVSDHGDGAPLGSAEDATASPRPWRERVPRPPKRIDWGPKQLRDLIAAQEVELTNMKSALDLSIQMEDAWRRRAQAGANQDERPPGADEALAAQKMQTLLRELQKMRDQMSTLLPHPFRGQMSTTFDDVDARDGTVRGMMHFLMELFAGVQHQRMLLRKRQKQLRLIREPGAASPSAAERPDSSLMTPAEEKELEKRVKEADARAMCDIKMVGQIAALKHEVRSLKKELDAARDAEGRARQHEKVIELLKVQIKQWETEGQAMMDRQKIREHEAAVQRKEVERAVAERNAMEQQLADAPKVIEKQQKLLSKRNERIKDLEEEAQTLRLLLKGRTPAKVETHLHVDSASGELQIGFGTSEAEPELSAMPTSVPVA